MKMMPAGSDDGLDALYSQEEPENNEGKKSIDQEESEDMEETQVLPVKFLQSDGPPLKPGDEVVIKVKSIEGDQAIVMYAPHKEKEETAGETGPEETGEEVDSLNSGNY